MLLKHRINQVDIGVKFLRSLTVSGMRSLVLVPASRRQVFQVPWHVFLLSKNHDKTDFVYRMLAVVSYPIVVYTVFFSTEIINI